MTTLVTGFDAFGEWETNTSELVATAVAGLSRPGVIVAVLPTSFRRAEEMVLDQIRLHRPRTVLVLGMDAGVDGVALEQVALNLDDAPGPDNDGEVRHRRRICDDGPVGYWSSLPLEEMAEAASGLGEQVYFSHDAGAYVCNHVFFTAAHALARDVSGARCGLVHIPCPGEDDGGLERLVRLVLTWLSQWEAEPDALRA